MSTEEQRKRWLAHSSAGGSTDPSTAILTELREINGKLDAVTKSRTLLYPIGTVAWGVFIGLIAFSLIAAILGGLLWFPRIPVH